MSVLKYGETAGREVSKRVLEPVADEAALALLSSTQCAHLASIRVGAAWWYYDKDSAAAASAGSVVEPADSVGRFLIDNPLGDVPAARTITSGDGLTGGGDLSANRTLAVGAGDGITVAADSVAVTFGLVGEMAAGVAAANAAGGTAKAARIDHAHAHGAQAIGDGTNHAVATASVAGFMSAADKTKLDAVQSFDATLVAGTVTKATGIVVTASTRVVSITPTVRGGTFPAGGFESLTAGNVVGGAGVGAVTITARKADGTLENACTDTVSVLLAG